MGVGLSRVVTSIIPQAKQQQYDALDGLGVSQYSKCAWMFVYGSKSYGLKGNKDKHKTEGGDEGGGVGLGIFA